MKETTYTVIFITAPSTEEARQISKRLLQQKKAACVNIIPKVNSLFWWENKIDSAEESLLVVKTKTSAIPDIIKLVKEEHSDTVPEIIALPIIDGNQDYLKWIEKSTL